MQLHNIHRGCWINTQIDNQSNMFLFFHIDDHMYICLFFHEHNNNPKLHKNYYLQMMALEVYDEVLWRVMHYISLHDQNNNYYIEHILNHIGIYHVFQLHNYNQVMHMIHCLLCFAIPLHLPNVF